MSHPPESGAPVARRFVLIPAAGSGSRFGSATPKQYALLSGQPLLAWTIDAFGASVENRLIEAVYVVVNTGDAWIDAMVAGRPAWRNWVHILRCGGESRAESVLNGLDALADVCRANDWILVHDAARPGLEQYSLNALCEQLADDEVGGLLALPLADTIKRASVDTVGVERVAATVSREGLWAAQTPQMFRYHLLQSALRSAQDVTDEASAIELAGFHPRLVRGTASNLKVTLAHDLAMAEFFIKATSMTSAPNLSDTIQTIQTTDTHAAHAVRPPFRIGQGYDCHALVEGRKLVIGGVHIPHETGLAGHSDADVLLHAVTDALLGAAALGDIGRHFPDTDAAHAGADSRDLLRTVVERVRAAGYLIGNIDATVIAQRPRLASYIPAMQRHLSEDCGIGIDCVNVKAKTNERLGYLGREEGMAAEAVALIYPVTPLK